MPFRLSTVLALFLVSLSAAQPPRSSFREAVDARFTAWARDGSLSAARTASLVNNPAIRGDDAAAAAALHLYFRDLKPGGALTRADLANALAQEGQSERRDLAAKTPHLDAHYRILRERLQATPRKIFAADAPQRAGVSQGILGDCYIVSAVGSALAQRPKSVRGMFKPYSDGSCDIVFADGKTIRVPPLTDAQIALGASAGAQGTWINVLETAFALRAVGRPPPAGTVALDALCRGGNPGSAIQALTGRRAVYYPIGRTHSKDVVAASAAANKQAAAVRDLLRGLNADRRLMCALTDEKELAPPGMAGKHAHAILRYDASTDWVTIWNPWGNEFVPRDVAGVGQGYTVRNGEFAVTVPEFIRIFHGISYETDKKLP